MVDEEVKSESTPAEESEPQTPANDESVSDAPQTEAPAEETPAPKAEEPKKSEEPKAAEKKGTAKDKKSKGDDKKGGADGKKGTAQLKKEWEDSIVSNKRVKREEMRRKAKRILVIMLVFSLVVTSIVYIMLQFIEENNVRITARSSSDKRISLTMDNTNWTPFMNAKGPNKITNVSYDPAWGLEKITTKEEVAELLSLPEVPLGTRNGEKYICFVFKLKNNNEDNPVNIDYYMTVDGGAKGLVNATRVMWGECFKNDIGDPEKVFVDVYSTLSYDASLKGNLINPYDPNAEEEPTTFKEYCAYPKTNQYYGSVMFDDDLTDFERQIFGTSSEDAAREAGFFACTPFESSKRVFTKNCDLAPKGEMYCYVCIWLEGTDYDCTDDKLGDYVKFSIDFEAR